MSQAAQAAGGAAAPGTGDTGNYGGQGPEVGFDPKAAIADLKRARGETQRLATAFDSHRQETAGDRELLQRLKGAIAPESKEPPSKTAHIQSQMDVFLEQMLDLKAKGQQIPMTQQIALDFYQSQLDNLKTIEALEKQIKDLRGGVDRANDPEGPVNGIAYTQMDTFLQQSLDNLYGVDAKQQKTKARVYDTVTAALAEDLKLLQKESPGQWDMLRRNPMKLQAVVNDVLRTIVPPKAMEMIEREELANTPMSAGELWGAFREAQAQFKGAKTHESKMEALELQRRIRKDILDLDKNKSKRPPQRR